MNKNREFTKIISKTGRMEWHNESWSSYRFNVAQCFFYVTHRYEIRWLVICLTYPPKGVVIGIWPIVTLFIRVTIIISTRYLYTYYVCRAISGLCMLCGCVVIFVIHIARTIKLSTPAGYVFAFSWNDFLLLSHCSSPPLFDVWLFLYLNIYFLYIQI